MDGESATPFKRALDPIDRITEVLFGLIMTLTFTGSISILTAGRDDVRTMLLGALGCNLAWGIIDGVFYLITCLAQNAHFLQAVHRAHGADSPEASRRAFRESFPALGDILQDEDIQNITRRMKEIPDMPSRARLHKEDFRGALAVCLLVFLSTFPVVLPFLFIHKVTLAMRISNAVAIVMLFGTGFAYGRLTRRHPFLVGLFMVTLGGILVSLTIAMGG